MPRILNGKRNGNLSPFPLNRPNIPLHLSSSPHRGPARPPPLGSPAGCQAQLLHSPEQAAPPAPSPHKPCPTGPHSRRPVLPPLPTRRCLPLAQCASGPSGPSRHVPLPNPRGRRHPRLTRRRRSEWGKKPAARLPRCKPLDRSRVSHSGHGCRGWPRLLRSPSHASYKNCHCRPLLFSRPCRHRSPFSSLPASCRACNWGSQRWPRHPTRVSP